MYGFRVKTVCLFVYVKRKADIVMETIATIVMAVLVIGMGALAVYSEYSGKDKEPDEEEDTK